MLYYQNYIGLYGYLLLSMYHLINIINHKTDIELFINIITFSSYYCLFMLKYQEIKTKIPNENYSKGHILLFLFYSFNHLFSDVIHYRQIDTLSLLGHLFLLKETNYAIIGQSILIVFYLLSIIKKHEKNEKNIFIYLHSIGGSLLVIYYFIYIYSYLFNKHEKNKHKIKQK